MAQETKVPDFVLPPSSTEVRRREQERAPEQQKTVPDFALPNAKPEPRSLTSDIVGAVPAGVAAGIVGLPGTAGDIQSLYHRGASWLAEKAGMGDREEIFRRLEGPSVLRLPKSREVIAGAERMVPGLSEYTSFEPQSVPGKIVKGTFQAAAPGAIPGRVGAFASLMPGSYGQRVLSGAGAGAGGESLGEALEGTDLETAGRLTGAIAGGIGGSAVGAALRARSAPAVAERAERIAGQILRESSPSPGQTAQKIERELAEQAADPNRYVQGVRPTTSQIVRDPGLADVERSVMSLAPSSSEAAALSQQGIANRAALGAEAAGAPQMVSAAIPNVDLKAAFSFPGPNPQNIASQNVRRAIDAIEQSLDATQKAAWQNPALAKTSYFNQKSFGAIDDYINSLNMTQRRAIDPRVSAEIKTYFESGQKTVPLDALQSMRSAILDDAREAIRKGRSSDWFINNELAKKIASVMNDPKNIQFGDSTGQARKAWQDAVASTKSYYDTFRPDFMKKLVAETKGGSPVVPGNVVFDEMFKGSRAAQNFDEAYRVLGPQLHSEASTWVLGKLTDNGRDLVLRQSDVNRFMSNPNNAAIVAKIPGLDARIADLVVKSGESLQAAQLRNVSNAFQTAVANDNPRILANFLAKNGAVLKSTLPPDGQRFLDSLQRSAKSLDVMSPGTAANKKTLEMLSNNSIGGILYGRALGRIPDVVGGELITYLLGKAAGISAPGAGAILGATGVGRQATSELSDKFTRMMFGPTKDETVALLQRAMRDPQLASVLMQKPNAANIDGVLDALVKSSGAIARTGARAQPAFAEQTQEPRPLTIPGRKFGGRVMSAEHMVAAADRAKKAISGKTEALLKSSDETVAKALEIAKQNLEG